MNRYTVIYRTGGTERYEWHRALVSGTYAQMQAKAAELAQQGYKALVHDAKQLDSIGLPESYE